MFTWIEDLKETNEIIYEKHKYRIIVSKIRRNYRIDLLEDNVAIVLENTSNDSFLKLVNKNEPVNKQIISWASSILKNHYNICDRCKESKLVFELYENDKGKEFNELYRICRNCRKEIYDEIFLKVGKAEEKKSKKFGDYLKERPPIIVGGFKERIDAYKYILNMSEKHIEKIDKDFIFAKAILRANDGSFYPVFCVIDISSGGELWDSQFIAENIDKYIPQEHIFPYIGKKSEDIFPYTYETLAVIEEDFHQDSWFGRITHKKIRHHLSNLIQVNWAEYNDEDDDIEKFDLVTVRTYFSIQHLLSVALVIKQIRNLEKKLNNHYEEINFLTHRSLCISAVFSAVSFLEAEINELFMDSYDNHNGMVRDMPNKIVNELSQMWELGIPRTANYSIIEKYQIALTLAKKNKMNIGISPAQDISALIKLRNALVHYEPEWVTTKDANNSSSAQKIEKLLKYKFELNTFTGENNPYFPDKCLSLGCIDWALKSIISFSDNFFISMGVIPPYEKVRYKVQQIMVS